MAYATTRDGVNLYYEETGRGTPLVFVHEFSGDSRSWEPQVRYFSRRYRCVTFNARGYPPSDVPRGRSRYSHAIVTDDLADVMRHLGMRKAHVVGCSMGAYTTIQFGLRYARLARSLTSIGAGAGSEPRQRARFLRDTEMRARRYETIGLPAALHRGSIAPGRVPYLNKDPRGYAEFMRDQHEHSGLGLANTLRGIQARRPPVYTLGKALARLKVPLLVVSGDEDESARGPALFIKQSCASARLAIFPATGHAVNVEEPDRMNHMLLDFLTLVDSGRWRPRDPRTLP